MAYKEIKLPKGAAEAVFGGLNDNMKPKKVNDNGTKKKTGKAKKDTPKKK